MKITIYELISRVNSGNHPQKIKHNNKVYEYEKEQSDYKCVINGCFYYLLDETNVFEDFNNFIEIIEDRCECTDKDVEKLFEKEKENEFTGCKWFVRGKETMSMEYENSENWFKAKELIESLSSIEKTKEEKDIEELNLDTDELLKNVVITAQDYVIEGKINELVREVNKLKNRKEEK